MRPLMMRGIATDFVTRGLHIANTCTAQTRTRHPKIEQNLHFALPSSEIQGREQCAS